MSLRALRGPMTVVTASAVSSPMLPHVLAGDMPLSSALLRFLVVMTLCWVCFNALANLAAGYEARAHHRTPQQIRERAHGEARQPGVPGGPGRGGLGGRGGP